MSTVPDEGVVLDPNLYDSESAMWHPKSRAYYGAKIESSPGIYLRHQRSCSDYGPVMFDSYSECDMMYGETAYHRQTYMGVYSEGSVIAKSSEPSWVAVQGKDCACIVTWNEDIAGGNSKSRDDFEDIFHNNLFKELEAAVSLQLGINEITLANDWLDINEITVGNGRAASFVERNNIVVTSFLRKLLKMKLCLSYHETIMLAVYLFDQVFQGFVKADKIKVFVLENGKDIITVEHETLLEDSRKCYGEKRLSMNSSRPMKRSRSNVTLMKESRKIYRKMGRAIKRSYSMKHSYSRKSSRQ